MLLMKHEFSILSEPNVSIKKLLVDAKVLLYTMSLFSKTVESIDSLI